MPAQPKLVDYPTHWIFDNQFVGLEQHEKVLDETRRLREALERILQADHMPYRSFKSYVLSESRKALSP